VSIRERCPVCEATVTGTFLTRRRVPVHQNLLVGGRVAARGATRGDLELAACRGCGFVFNTAFDPDMLSYGADYDNTQTCSAAFRAHMAGLVERMVNEAGVANCRIVEIGCGKGEFLRRLVEPEALGNVGIGFDPSHVGPDRELDGRLTFHKRCYDETTCTDVRADVVVCRHVVEHVAEPLRLLRTIRKSLAASPNPRVFLETPCVERILRNRVAWDFFYEHCSLFGRESLSLAFQSAGLKVKQVRHLFGGQYLWIESQGFTESTPEPGSGAEVAGLAAEYAAAEGELVGEWRRRARHWAAKGPLALWGAGAKGCTLANLIDPEAEILDCVIDLNPAKAGHYVAGTGHPIVGPDQIGPRRIAAAILTNPNYRGEVADLLRREGPPGTRLLEYT